VSKTLPADIGEMLDRAADRYGIPRALARAVAWVESRGERKAVSKAGAIGIMQLMPGTAKTLGVLDPYDAESNIDGGTRYLASLIERLGSVERALAGYNWGPSRVKAGGPWPAMVNRYVAKVLDAAGGAELFPPSSSSSSETKTASAPDPKAAQAAAPLSRSSGSEPHCPSCSCFKKAECDA
jgi:soluble lytic murein transglycosylase-like protein